MSTKIAVSLYCATCGQGDFEHNEDKSWMKCKNCGREYQGGIDELATFNQNQIQDAVEEVGQQFIDDFAKRREKTFRGNKFIKFKRR